ncbi:NADP-dependent oxidoreductase domain-containing protein [Blastocladiella britannica]|nr:NADP-dependent oxidoreductase domain-containing protein [Blastocladiella britannica]
MSTSESLEFPPMEYRFLGKSGLKVSVLSLGGWVTYGGQVKDDVTYQCMKTAYELGVNFFDTAEVYASGQSEVDMGKAIKRLGEELGTKRSDLVISTKLFWAGKGVNDRGLSRKHIIEGLRASLDRMDQTYVDVVFAHRPDPDTPMEETVRAFNHVIERGWAFYWGTSEWSAQEITEAHLVAQRLNLIGPLCEQPQYNMLHRERFEKEYAPLYKHHGLGTTIWSPLASGVLTGKYNDLSNLPEGSRLTMADNPVMARIRAGLDTDEGKAKIAKVAALMPIADRLGCTTAQLALAWCVLSKNVSTVITGASRPEQVKENIRSLAAVAKITPDVRLEIEAVLDNQPSSEYNFRNA